MGKLMAVTLLSVLVAGPAIAEDDTFVRGSFAVHVGSVALDLPISNEWAGDLTSEEREQDHSGTNEKIQPRSAYGAGFGVTFGKYVRFDASLTKIKQQTQWEYHGTDYNRNITYKADITPFRLEAVFIPHGFVHNVIRPELGLGIAAFVTRFEVDQEINSGGNFESGQAWVRDVCYLPVMKAGVEFNFYDRFGIGIHWTYFTGEVELKNWSKRYTALVGPNHEYLGGWTIAATPRFYF
jgi:hypothetical protein